MKRLQNAQTKQQQNRRHRLGTALVEMALVLPIFFMVVLGIVEFGRAMMVGQMVTNAAREGARLAVIDGNTNADVKAHINSFLTNSINASESDVTIAIDIEPANSLSSTPTDVVDAKPRDLIQIRVTVPFSAVNYVPGNYLADKNLIGQSSMRHE